MKIFSTYSENNIPSEAAGEIKKKITLKDPTLVLYFASSNYDQQNLAENMKKNFPDTCVCGCSTSGEIVSGKMLKNSVVAMAFSQEAVKKVHLEVVEKISKENGVPAAFSSFEKKTGKKMRDLDLGTTVGIILIDGLRGSEEKIMEKIGDLTDVPFIGGAAGDDLKFKMTHVYAGGKAFTDAAVLLLLDVPAGYEILKTQSFRCLDKKLKVTKADEKSRKVLEFNNKPAVTAYAEAVGTDISKASDHFMKHPVGLMAGDEPYVRSPQQVSDKAMVFYCGIKEGMELSLLESTDIVRETETAFGKTVKSLGSVSGVINFHCILRTLELESVKKTAEYGKIFEKIPAIGFSTYGEEYIGHINQTSTILIFK